jgi:hypothetical protein
MKLVQLVFMAAMLSAGFNASALDVSTAKLPARLVDNAITIGDRTLQLPAGDWILVAEQKSFLELDNIANARISMVFLALVKEKKLLASVVLTLPETSISSGERLRWSGETCGQQAGYLYREEFDSNWRAPACLLVFDRIDYLRSTGPLLDAARAWIASEGIETTAPYYYVRYSKHGDRDLGQIQVFLPERSVSFSSEVGNWGTLIHEKLSRFFEKRDRQATLPDLPFRP